MVYFRLSHETKLSHEDAIRKHRAARKKALLTIELNLTFLSTPGSRCNPLYLIGGGCFKSETIQFELLNFITSIYHFFNDKSNKLDN